jgi:hypothetical protein
MYFLDSKALLILRCPLDSTMFSGKKMLSVVRTSLNLGIGFQGGKKPSMLQ